MCGQRVGPVPTWELAYGAVPWAILGLFLVLVCEEGSLWPAESWAQVRTLTGHNWSMAYREDFLHQNELTDSS